MLLDEAKAKGLGKYINWSRVEDFKPYGGIRIEDNIVVTADGCESLSNFSRDLRVL